MIEINLSPGSGKKGKPKRAPARSSSPSGPAFSLDLGSKLSGLWASVTNPLLLGAVASLGLGIGGVAWMKVALEVREADLTARLEQAVADSTRYRAALDARLAAEATRDTIVRQINVIKAIDGERFIWPHVLDEVSRALPPYTWITGLTVAGNPQGHAFTQAAITKLGGDTTVTTDAVRLRLAGQTVDLQALTRFMRQLELSPFLADVNLERSELVLDAGKEVTQYTLEMSYTRPDSTAIRRVPLTVPVR